MGEVLEAIKAGKSPKSQGRPAEADEFGVLKVSAVSWKEFNPAENKALIPGQDHEGWPTVEKNDLLISRANTVELVGAVVLAKENYPNLFLSDKTLRLVPIEQAASREFLLYVLRTKSVRDHFEEKATGTSDSMRNISQAKMRSAPIPLPPLNEQRRIVEKIEALSAHSRKAREALDSIPALLDQFRQSVLAAAFRGDLTADWRAQHPEVEPASALLERIRTERRQRWEAAELEKMRAKGKEPKNDKWKAKYKEPLDFDAPDLPDLPESWTWASADECTSLITDGEHATPKRQEEGVYLLSARNVLNGKISFKKVDYISTELHQKLNERIQLQQGDVLLSCSGTVGRSCTVPKGLECSFVRSVAILKPFLKMGDFVSLAIRSSIVQAQIEQKKTQTAQSNLFQGRIKILALPLAPLEEQQEILSQVERLMMIADSIKNNYGEAMSEQTQLDQSILAKAFRGQLVPQDPTDEPASLLLDRIRTERETAAAAAKAAKTKQAKSKRSKPQ